MSSTVFESFFSFFSGLPVKVFVATGRQISFLAKTGTNDFFIRISFFDLVCANSRFPDSPRAILVPLDSTLLGSFHRYTCVTARS
ncbi:MAG TPA: hypothetical protein VMB85_11370 [Bryobacteraceae bacterium]|jgi:hypothetical protein|nr:hypothetical protein [Bryobacteraceae bacterium]